MPILLKSTGEDPKEQLGAPRSRSVGHLQTAPESRLEARTRCGGRSVPLDLHVRELISEPRQKNFLSTKLTLLLILRGPVFVPERTACARVPLLLVFTCLIWKNRRLLKNPLSFRLETEQCSHLPLPWDGGHATLRKCPLVEAASLRTESLTS